MLNLGFRNNTDLVSGLTEGFQGQRFCKKIGQLASGWRVIYLYFSSFSCLSNKVMLNFDVLRSCV